MEEEHVRLLDSVFIGATIEDAWDEDGVRGLVIDTIRGETVRVWAENLCMTHLKKVPVSLVSVGDEGRETSIAWSSLQGATILGSTYRCTPRLDLFTDVSIREMRIQAVDGTVQTIRARWECGGLQCPDTAKDLDINVFICQKGREARLVFCRDDLLSPVQE